MLAKLIFKVLCSSSSARLFTFFIPYRLPECSILSKSFALCVRRPKIPLPESSTPMGERIYCHPQTDCFVLSELFSVARHVGCSLYITFFCFLLPLTAFCFEMYAWFGLVWFGLALWHINHSRLSNAESIFILILFTNPSARAGYDTRSIF